MNRCQFCRYIPHAFIFRSILLHIPATLLSAPLPSICDTLALQRSKFTLWVYLSPRFLARIAYSAPFILDTLSIYGSNTNRTSSPCIILRLCQSVTDYPFSPAALTPHLMQPLQTRTISQQTMTSKQSFKWPPLLGRPLMGVPYRPEIPEHSYSSVMYARPCQYYPYDA